jgi:peptidoglycan hydrolase CwlO-like protein
MSDWDDIERAQRGDYEDEGMENRKSGWVPAVVAAIGTAVLTQVLGGLADRTIQRSESTADQFTAFKAEFSTRMSGVEQQLGKLVSEPYATREELQRMQNEHARFDERLERVERRVFKREQQPDRSLRQ